MPINGEQAKATYGSVIGMSRRIDQNIHNKHQLGDTFSQTRKYYD